MKDFDKILEEDNQRNFFFNAPGYEGKKIMVGKIGVKNAEARLEKEEYYTLVTYQNGEQLPEGYMPLDESVGEELLATIDPRMHMSYVSVDGGIQKVSKLSDDEYLLGPGPDQISLSSIVRNQIKEYQEMEKGFSK